LEREPFKLRLVREQKAGCNPKLIAKSFCGPVIWGVFLGGIQHRPILLTCTANAAILDDAESPQEKHPKSPGHRMILQSTLDYSQLFVP
jgi:hypothetical protein